MDLSTNFRFAVSWNVGNLEHVHYLLHTKNKANRFTGTGMFSLHFLFHLGHKVKVIDIQEQGLSNVVDVEVKRRMLNSFVCYRIVRW